MLRSIARGAAALLQRVVVATLTITVVAGMWVGIRAYANYTATQGSGITMASVVLSNVHYLANLICDATAGQSQCLAVNASGQAQVSVANANSNGAATPGNSSPVVQAYWTPFLLNGISTTVKSIKASAGQFGGVQCYNPNSSQIYLQVFNVASGSVTLGTTVPSLSIPIGPTASGGWAQPGGFNFGTAMSAAATTTATGNGAPITAADCNVAYN